jgi:Tfp pilus assembly protein PilO
VNLRTPGATKILGALVLLLVAALGWLLVVGPETSALADARSQIQSTRDQNQGLAAQLSALEAQRKELGPTRRAAKKLAEKFPPTADQPGLFEAVTAAAVDAGIGADGATTLAPSPPQVGGADAATGAVGAGPATGGNLANQTVTVSITGGYDQTEQLLENLEQMPRAYLITGVTLGGGDGGYTTTVTGEMFVMPPVTDPGNLPAADS